MLARKNSHSTIESKTTQKTAQNEYDLITQNREYRKKMNILKQAYLKEKEENKHIQKNLELANKKIQSQKAEIEEKIRNMIKLQKKNEDLKEQIINERIAKNQQQIEQEQNLGESGFMSNMKNYLSLGYVEKTQQMATSPTKETKYSKAEYDSLQKDYLLSRKQTEDLERQVQECSKKMEANNVEHVKEIELYRQEINDIEQKVEQKKKELDQVTLEYKQTCQQNLWLLSEKEDKEQKLEEVKVLVRQKDNEIVNYSQTIIEKYLQFGIISEEQIRDLNVQVDVLEREKSNLKQSLQYTKNQIQEIEDRIQIYELEKVTSMSRMPCLVYCQCFYDYHQITMAHRQSCGRTQME